MNYTLHCGDCLDIVTAMPDATYSAVFCDPPYGLGETPDMAEVLTHWLAGDDYKASGGGFMGKAWDSFVPGPSVWKEVYRVCKPGAVLLAFGGTRTADLLSIAIRLAGWQRWDEIVYFWTYGSGFPKGHDISKAIDKAAGATREVVGSKAQKDAKFKLTQEIMDNGGFNDPLREGYNITAPATTEAATWAGYNVALKPAYEPILCFRKPLEATYAHSALTYGTAALNIDGTRIMTKNQQRDADAYRRLSSLYYDVCSRNATSLAVQDALLRIVSVLRSYSTVCTGRWHGAGDQGDNQTDLSEYEILANHLYPNGAWCGLTDYKAQGSLADCPFYRHFCDEHIHLLLEAAQSSAPLLADALERTCLHQRESEHNHGCQHIDRLSNCDDSLPAFCLSFLLDAWRHYTTYSSPPQGRWPANVIHDGSDEVMEVFDRAGVRKSAGDYPTSFVTQNNNKVYGVGVGNTQGKLYSDTGSAARFFYCAKSSARERNGGLDGMEVREKKTLNDYVHPSEGRTAPKNGSPMANHHPTVKPLALTEYLARLIVPPESYRDDAQILIPYAGVGSEAIGAAKAGWRNITGIELDAEYCEINRRRFAHWTQEAANTARQAALFTA